MFIKNKQIIIIKHKKKKIDLSKWKEKILPKNKKSIGAKPTAIKKKEIEKGELKEQKPTKEAEKQKKAKKLSKRKKKE